MKKKLSIIALIALILITFFSCSRKEEATVSNASTGSTSTAAATSDSADEVRTYDMFIRSQYHDWIKELKWYDVAEERTGIHVNYIDGPLEINDTFTEVDQRLASRPQCAVLHRQRSTVRKEHLSTLHRTSQNMHRTSRHISMQDLNTRHMFPMRKAEYSDL